MKFLLSLFFVGLLVLRPSLAEENDVSEDEHLNKDVPPVVITDAIELKDLNFEWAIKLYEHVFVLFIPDPCEQCNESIRAEFELAAKKLKEEKANVLLAHFNTTLNPKFGKKYGRKEISIIKFFVNGKSINYNGGLTAKEMIYWVNQKIIPASSHLIAPEEVFKFTSILEISLIFFGEKNSNEFFEYYASAVLFDDLSFAHVLEPLLWKNYGVSKNTIIMYKKKGAEKILFDSAEIDMKNLKSWILKNIYPPVMEITKRSAARLFEEKDDALVLIVKDSKDPALNALYAVQDELKNEIILSYVTLNEYGKKFAEYIGVSASEVPALRIVRQDFDLIKYKPITNDIEKDSIIYFYKSFKAGTIQPLHKSQSIPSHNNNRVKTIVSKTWDEIVRDESKDVLVLLHSNNEEEYLEILKALESVALKFEDKKDLVIGTMNAIENEVNGLRIRAMPSLRLFLRRLKNQPYELFGEKNEQTILSFLKEKGRYIIKLEGEDEAEQHNPDLIQCVLLFFFYKNYNNIIVSVIIFLVILQIICFKTFLSCQQASKQMNSILAIIIVFFFVLCSNNLTIKLLSVLQYMFCRLIYSIILQLNFSSIEFDPLN